ncbi:hypothetical protein ACFLWX_02715 [Chloroflexota bacterium]
MPCIIPRKVYIIVTDCHGLIFFINLEIFGIDDIDDFGGENTWYKKVRLKAWTCQAQNWGQIRGKKKGPFLQAKIQVLKKAMEIYGGIELW